MSQAGSVTSEPAQSDSNARVASPGQESSKTEAGIQNQDTMASGQRMIFSGPNSLRQHRVTVPDNFMFVGIGERSAEMTSQMAYLSRPAPATPFPKSRYQHVGEVGWSAEYFNSPLGQGQSCAPLTR